MVKTTIDAKRRGRNCHRHTNVKLGSYLRLVIRFHSHLTHKKTDNSQISHQTGAQLIALPFQIMELIKKLRQPNPVHIMYRQVPVFQANNV